MRVGVPTEIREEEYRVALTPAGTKELTSRGHDVLVPAGAGEGSSFPTRLTWPPARASCPMPRPLFAQADLIVKVKEPLHEEYVQLEPRHILFTYLHLAPDPDLTRALVDSGATCLAYETVETADGLQAAARAHERDRRAAGATGGRLLPGAHERRQGQAPRRRDRGQGRQRGDPRGRHRREERGRHRVGHGSAHQGPRHRSSTPWLTIQRQPPGVETLHSDQLTIEEEVATADLVIGAILVSGATTPVLVSEDVVRAMQPGSVIVDLSVDQGGCVATSRVTTHRDPTFVKHGVIHYGVDNMAGVVPITSTLALTNVTLPYILAVADKGVVAAARSDPSLARGVNVMEGKVTMREVAEATGNPYFPLEYVLPIEYM